MLEVQRWEKTAAKQPSKV